jgi:hypothetical protein
MIEQFSLFTREECAAIRQRIHELRHLWIPRLLQFEHEGTILEEESYTLGVASYCDAWQDPAHYLDAAKETNIDLRRHFGWIYPRLADAVERVTRRKAAFDDELALPGFHIFLASRVFELPVAPIHFDFHARLLTWDGRNADLQDTISYTGSISLPRGGAGLNIWDLTSVDVEDLGYREITTLAERRQKTRISYSVGNAVLHSADIVHQIAPWHDVSPDDERITLQGQGIRVDDSYLLFW